MSKTIRYTEHMAPSTASAKRRLQAALKRAKRQHPRWESIEARFIANGSSGPIVVRVEVPA